MTLEIICVLLALGLAVAMLYEAHKDDPPDNRW